MAVFKKEIIRPTRVFPFDSRGKEYPVDIGFDRIQHWAAGLKKLFKKGYRIPIPYDHTQEAVPLGPEEEEPVGPDGEPLYRNAGFFTDIEFERDGTLHLLGEPKTEQDLKRVLKDHVSLKSAETFRDRDGEVYEDVIVHVAATNKPIFTKQSEWKPAHGLALSLGQPNEPLSTPYPTSGNDPGGPGKTNSLENILELLREHG
ncbi:hypothetical protein, partial [Marinobacter sediminum]|uniref:hypothetical protein n=1 Tax=Marinobacter sediminum TaxID=256323 RepID=UPI0035635034